MVSKIALTIFIAFELCYYLLIAQTGIVEYFSSNIFSIASLPIGGIIGSVLVYYIQISKRYKIFSLLTLQLLISFSYPDLSKTLLFLLGISVGGLAPLVIYKIKDCSNIQLAFALGVSYSLGTFLFTIEPANREFLAIVFTLITLIAAVFIKRNKKQKKQTETTKYSLFIMVLWVFLDSALFETLSRDITIPIWRDGYTIEIILFHLIGIIAAFVHKFEKIENEIFIILLFALSYLFYFLQEAFILSIVYPFVISYYNVTILKSIKNNSFKTLCIYMIFIGWVASGLGLFIALEDLLLFVPLIFLASIIKVINSHNLITKEKECIN